jgi:hypothetical protein
MRHDGGGSRDSAVGRDDGEWRLDGADNGVSWRELSPVAL